MTAVERSNYNSGVVSFPGSGLSTPCEVTVATPTLNFDSLIASEAQIYVVDDHFVQNLARVGVAWIVCDM